MSTPLVGNGVGILYLALFASPFLLYGYTKIPQILAAKRIVEFRNVMGLIYSFLYPGGTPESRQFIILCVTRACVAIPSKLLDVYVPIQLGHIVDRLASSESVGFPWRDLFALGGLRFINSRAGIGFLDRWLAMKIEALDAVRVKSVIYNHLMSLSSDYHDSSSTSKTIPFLNQINGVIRTNESVLFVTIPQLISLCVTATNFASVFGPWFAAVFVTVVVIYFVFETWESLYSYRAGREFSRSYSAERRLLDETLTNWATVSSFGRVESSGKRLVEILEERRVTEYKKALNDELLAVAKHTIVTGGLLCVSGIAIYQIRNSGRSAGDFVMATTCWAQIIILLRNMSSLLLNYTYFLGSIHEVVPVLNLKPVVVDKVGARDLEYKGGRVEFEGVDFSYAGNTKTVKDLTFQVEGGGTIALVGETGGGKSTLVKLLCRRYDPSSGSIKIDGQDVRDVTQASLRKHFAIVPQEICIFGGTLLYNLKYGNPEATQEQVEESCKAACIHDRIMKFPAGYETEVGQGGTRLSGGEMQRLAIARMILKDAPIVVLDEAMSSLDSETDWTIQRNLRKWAKGRTMVMVAHRLSTISHADLILVIKGGEIVESGSQRVLIEKKGHYHSMWVKQMEMVEAGEEVAGTDQQELPHP